MRHYSMIAAAPNFDVLDRRLVLLDLGGIGWGVGAKFTGLLDGYDPDKDPANWWPCHACDGAGVSPGVTQYAAVVPGPDGCLNTFRGPNREQVVLAAAEYIHAVAVPVAAPLPATRHRARKLVSEPFAPEAVLRSAGVAVEHCHAAALRCEVCGGTGKQRRWCNVPHAGDCMIAGQVDWEGIKDRKAAKEAERWDATIHNDRYDRYIAEQRERAPSDWFMDMDGALWRRSDMESKEFDSIFWAFAQTIPPDWVVYVLDVSTQR